MLTMTDKARDKFKELLADHVKWIQSTLQERYHGH